MRRATPLRLAAGIGLVAAVVLTGCAAGGSTPDTDARIVWVVEGGNLANGHLDPHSSQLDSSAYLQRAVFDSLVQLDADGTFHPWLAAEWAVSDDGLSYTFRLREDVLFHDGERFDAEAVVANFEHITAEETASAQAASQLGGDLFLGATAIDEYTVRLDLAAPFGPLLTNLSTAFFGFYSPVALAEHTQEQLRAGGPGISVGTGPFVLTAYEPNQELVYTRNEAYDWAPEGSTQQGPAAAAELVVRIVPDESGRVGALAGSEAQVAVDLTPTGLAQLGDAVGVQSTQSPGLPYSALLNWGHGVLADERVRQAFQAGIDLDAAVQGAYQGDYQRAWSVLSPTTPNAYDPALEGSWPYDPAAADALLDEAGWTERDADGIRVKDGERLTVDWLSWLPYPDERRALVSFLVDDLAEVGIELRHETVEGPAYQERYFTEADGFVLDFDVTDWGFASLDADILRNHLHSAGYQNSVQVADPALDALLDEAAASSDPTERAAIYGQVQEWNRDHVAIIPLYLPEFTVAWSPELQGLEFDAYGWPLLYGATLAD